MKKVNKGDENLQKQIKQSDAVKAMSDMIALEIFGMPREAAIKDGICINCHKKAVWMTEAGKREYYISGVCEPCFDDLFEQR